MTGDFCQPLWTSGPCPESDACPSGTFCSAAANTCVPLLPAGADCSEDPTGSCASGVCGRDHKCAANLQIGQPCVEGGVMSGCVMGWCDTGTGLCTDYVPLGGKCSQDDLLMCGPYQCIAGTCQMPACGDVSFF